MDLSTFVWTSFGAFLTLATFSFLYKDNPFYKIAEHMVVGVSAGYFVVILWHNSLAPNLFDRLADGNWYTIWLNSTQWWYIIPGFLGMLMWTRFSKNYQWVSRWPMGLYIGISAGLAVPLEMRARVIEQLYATMVNVRWSQFWGTEGFNLLDPFAGLAQILVFVGTISALIYFFFSKAHTGAFGAVAKVGIWTLMIGFGASFGFTVMARISLFINRIQYLDQDWGQTAFDSSNQLYSGWFQFFFWLVVLVFVIYIVYEILRFVRSRTTPPSSPTA